MHPESRHHHFPTRALPWLLPLLAAASSCDPKATPEAATIPRAACALKTVDWNDGGHNLTNIRVVDKTGRELQPGDVVTTAASPIKVYARLTASGLCKITYCNSNCSCSTSEWKKYASHIGVDVDITSRAFPSGGIDYGRINAHELGQPVIDAADLTTSDGPEIVSISAPGTYNFRIYGIVNNTICSSEPNWTETTSIPIYVIQGDDAANQGPTACNSRVGEPVNVTTGNMFLQQADFAIPLAGSRKLKLVRTYNSRSSRRTTLGGMSTFLDESIEKFGPVLLRVHLADGPPVYYRKSGSTYVPLSLAQTTAPQLSLQADGTFGLRFPSGELHTFLPTGQIASISDRNGVLVTVAYDGNMRPMSITSNAGHVINIVMTSGGSITSLSDSQGPIVTYAYNSNVKLQKVTYPDQSGFTFDYIYLNSALHLSQVKDLLGNVLEKHSYDSQGRALTSERSGGAEKYTLSYFSDTQTNVTDGLGRVTKYFFEKIRPAQDNTWRNQVTRVEGPCACGGSDVTTWTYHSNGNVATRTDALGRTQTYTYDAQGNLSTSRTADGALTSYTFGPFGLLGSVTDPLGGVTTLERDANGNLTGLTDPLSYRWSLSHDSRGLPLTVTSPREATSTFEYDAGNLVAVSDALGNRRSFTHDVRGRQVSATDSLGNVTSFTYDGAGKLKTATAPDGSVVTYTRDLAGRTTKVTDGRGNATTFAYDANYRLTQTTDALGKISRYGYDVMSRLISRTDPLGRVTTYAYDDHDRLVRVTHPPATTGAAPIVETFTYDLGGNLQERVDGAGGRQTFTYDAANRLITATDGAGRVTGYEYDLLGRLTAVVDPAGRRQEFSYDARGALTAVNRGPARSLLYQYDADGNRTVRQSFDGTRTTYAFDLLGRLTAIKDAAGTTLASYGYDSEGHLTSAQNADANLAFAFDNMGRLLSANDGAGTTLGYEYDAAGNRTVMQVGADRTITYGYNALDLPIQISDRGQTIGYAYDSARNRTSRTLPNGIVSTYGYDGMDRLESINHGSAVSLTFGRNGRHDLTSVSGPEELQAFQYDAGGWLSSASRDGVETERYTYDSTGNRTTSHLAQLYSCQALNQLTSADQVQFTYDPNGNLASRTDSEGTTEFAWDRDNRLLEVSLPDGRSVAYSYDALGRRRERIVSTGERQRYVYDDLDAILEIAQDGARREYLNGPGIDDHLLHRENGVATYYLENHQGSLVALASTTGAVLERLSYDSFGRSGGSALTRFDYTGRERDPATKLLDYRARWYDPSVGRFLSEDPLGIEGGVNLYLYVGNNPLNLTDPLGLKPFGDVVTDFTSGWGSTVSRGRTDQLQRILGIDDVVDRSSRCYRAGQIFGIINLVGISLAADYLARAEAQQGGSPTGPNGLPESTPATSPYKRPSGATTPAQRESVQGKPCVDCGAETPKQHADHKDPLVKEWYRTGKIDKDKMRDIDSVQPQCPDCSNSQGGHLSAFGRAMRRLFFGSEDGK